MSDGSCKKCGEIGRLKNSIDDECEWANCREVARSKASSLIDSVEDAEEMVS